MNYTDFFGNTGLYDKYSREEDTRYDVFVGEPASSYFVSKPSVKEISDPKRRI